MPLYFGALVAGAALGLTAPGFAGALGPAVTPVLAALLYVTFLGIPLTGLRNALGDVRFLGGLLVANFLFAPVLAFALSRIVADNRGLLLGALLVLLCPCVDYVIVFAGLAGAARGKLLAATPLLMGLQVVLLPLYLSLFAGRDAVSAIDPAPFAVAFLAVVLAPLAFAALTQALAARGDRPARSIQPARSNRPGPGQLAARIPPIADGAMVPLMMLTLAIVVAAHIDEVRGDAVELASLIPVYVLFLVGMAPLGLAAARLFGQRVAETRATVFSGATRNSLVVLPLALALPEPLSLAAAAVVTQTMIELLGMVLYVRLVPLLAPNPSS